MNPRDQRLAELNRQLAEAQAGKLSRWEAFRAIAAAIFSLAALIIGLKVAFPSMSIDTAYLIGIICLSFTSLGWVFYRVRCLKRGSDKQTSDFKRILNKVRTRSSEPLPVVTPDAKARSSPASAAPSVRGR